MRPSARELDAASVGATLGAVLKYREDQERLVRDGLAGSSRCAGVGGRRPLGRAATPSTWSTPSRTPAWRVPTDGATVLTEALAAFEPLERGPDRAYWAGRATLVRRPEDPPAVRRRVRGVRRRTPGRPTAATIGSTEVRASRGRAGGRRATATTATTLPDADDGRDARGALPARSSYCADRDFAGCTDAELAELAPAVDRLRVDAARRRVAATPAPAVGAGPARPAPHGARPRSAPTASRSARHHRSRRGAARAARAAGRRVGIDGALRPGAAAASAMPPSPAAARRGVHARHPGHPGHPRAAPRDPDAALEPRRRVVADWAGGTRLGDGLGGVQRRVGRRGMARGAVVVILTRRLGPRRSRRSSAEQMRPPAAASPTGSSGSTRSGPARATSPWPAAWPPRCPTSTTSSTATRSDRSKPSPPSSPADQPRSKRFSVSSWLVEQQLGRVVLVDVADERRCRRRSRTARGGAAGSPRTMSSGMPSCWFSCWRM